MDRDLSPGRRWLVRHACAGHKQEWVGDDDDRPLDPAGVEQARALGAVLALEAPRRLVASPPRRCVDTLVPLAEQMASPDRAPITVEPRLRDADGEQVVALLSEDASAGAVLCTHGEVMGPALTALRAAGLEVVGVGADEDLLLKGAAWRLDPRPDGGWRLDLVVPIRLTSCPHHERSDPSGPTT